MKTRNVIISTIICTLLLGGAAWAATDTKNLTINAAVAARATLTLGSAAINFPDSDPDTVNPIPATENAVSVTAKVRTGAASNPTLTVQASGPLTSGTDTIAISNVTWTATGSGFSAGTMNSTTPQTCGSWTGSGNRSGTFSYFLVNSWDYQVGNYTATATYLLTAP
jgi:hypothetical protein